MDVNADRISGHVTLHGGAGSVVFLTGMVGSRSERTQAISTANNTAG